MKGLVKEINKRNWFVRKGLAAVVTMLGKWRLQPRRLGRVAGGASTTRGR